MSDQYIKTTEGEIHIYGPASSERLKAVSIDTGLRSFRPALRQKEALVEIGNLELGRVVIAEQADEIVGYVTFHPPDSFERWSQGPKEVLELGAIEVSPRVRGHGVARGLLEVAFADEFMEDFLVVATEYFWHWDLEGTGLRVWEYRELMRQLMSHIGMVVRDTDDEEVAAHPANMLTVRYGRNLSREVIVKFEKILFQKPDSFRG